MSWDELTELLAGELRRVVDTHGNEAIYGGSYGWSSAGRFHHAQSQVHRFLKLLGGYTFSRHSYSLGATGVIMPRVVGTHDDLFKRSTEWDVIVEHTDLLVCFGGLALKNTGINHGGTTAHPARDALRRFRDRGGRIVSFSPLRDDVDGDCEWHAPVPGTDVAIMLALAYVLATESLADRDFLSTYCTGYETLRALSARRRRRRAEVAAVGVADLRAARRRTGRAGAADGGRAHHRHGQLVAAADPARRAGTVDGSHLGRDAGPNRASRRRFRARLRLDERTRVGHRLRFRLPALPQGPNPVRTFIPVAAVSDMLLHPGEQFDYNGRRLTYPDIKLVYWAGGNPFHHHQNISRLRRALARVDTVVVHDPYWTAMAKHADIVVPSTTSFERDDYSGSRNDPLLMAMPKLAEPYAQSRDDYTTFAALAERARVRRAVHRGPHRAAVAGSPVRQVGRRTRISRCRRSTSSGAPGRLRLPTEDGLTLLADFRADPTAHRLNTPSGRIEIFSADIDGFGYDDCAGHPKWYEPTEWLGGQRAAQLSAAPAGQSAGHAAAQPTRRRRGQSGVESARARTDPDASDRCRGARACRRRRGSGVQRPRRLPGRRGGRRRPAARRGAAVDRRMVRSADPADPDAMCVHGNPNVLTDDVGTSSLARGCTGAHVLVQVEKFTGPLPPVRAHEPPAIVTRA